jgi:hypothetical protein
VHPEFLLPFWKQWEESDVMLAKYLLQVVASKPIRVSSLSLLVSELKKSVPT